MESIIKDIDTVIIGAGLTGLSAAVHLSKHGKNIAILEAAPRVGGQIHTFTDGDFTLESGPNTGSGSAEEVLELFDITGTEIEFASKASEQRWIWKNNKFHALPSSLIGAITTPLFSWHDKFRILGEPWRKKGTNPDESVADLTIRRLGRSYLDYAVDPFLSGIYAGDAHTLVTRHALPKLYNLEQNYGSFIRGAIAKANEKRKSPLATPKPKGQTNIFSAKGGLERLAEGMARYIGYEHIFTHVKNIKIQPLDSQWLVAYQKGEEIITLRTPKVITTVSAYALNDLLSFIPPQDIAPITGLTYAPIIQVSVGLKDRGQQNFRAFGGLVGSKEHKEVLGILFPSSCFSHRAPERGLLMSFFMGGMRNKDLITKSDSAIESIVVSQMHEMLSIPKTTEPDLLRIFRHTHAIPQYEASSEARFMQVDHLQRAYQGLILGGNLRDGIGMAHRIIQGKEIALKTLK